MKRQFNIESITVGHTEQPGMSKMTFIVNVEDEQKIEQLVKQLQKQIDVIKVNDITDKAIVMRELALVKVISPPHVRSEMNSIIEPFRATVIDYREKCRHLPSDWRIPKRSKHSSICSDLMALRN